MAPAAAMSAVAVARDRSIQGRPADPWDPRSHFRLWYGIRTPELGGANAALSQLSLTVEAGKRTE
jgi:hypothetical protein